MNYSNAAEGLFPDMTARARASSGPGPQLWRSPAARGKRQNGSVPGSFRTAEYTDYTEEIVPFLVIPRMQGIPRFPSFRLRIRGGVRLPDGPQMSLPSAPFHANSIREGAYEK